MISQSVLLLLLLLLMLFLLVLKKYFNLFTSFNVTTNYTKIKKENSQDIEEECFIVWKWKKKYVRLNIIRKNKIKLNHRDLIIEYLNLTTSLFARLHFSV